VYFKKGELLIQGVSFKKRDFSVSHGKADVTKLQKLMKGNKIKDNFYENKIKKAS
jgi:hypothetical protein